MLTRGIFRSHRAIWWLMLSFLIALSPYRQATAAVVRTRNFQVYADSPKVARLVAESAETARKKIAIDWMGKELSRWASPCRLQVSISKAPARGLTSFELQNGRNGDWEIEVSGPLEDLIESVIPHEVSHTILASFFSHPLPRWADEGAAMMAESDAERKRQHLIAGELVQATNRMPLRRLLSLHEYPREASQMMAIYSVGYSLSDFLVQTAGRHQYLKLLAHAERSGWERAFFELYGYESIDSLEEAWSEWVNKGHPALKLTPGGNWI